MWSGRCHDTETIAGYICHCNFSLTWYYRVIHVALALRSIAIENEKEMGGEKEEEEIGKKLFVC